MNIIEVSSIFPPNCEINDFEKYMENDFEEKRFRDVKRNKAPKIAPDFGSSTRHIRRFISGYVPVDVIQKMDQKTSKMGDLYFSTSLNF